MKVKVKVDPRTNMSERKRRINLTKGREEEEKGREVRERCEVQKRGERREAGGGQARRAVRGERYGPGPWLPWLPWLPPVLALAARQSGPIGAGPKGARTTAKCRHPGRCNFTDLGRSQRLLAPVCRYSTLVPPCRYGTCTVVTVPLLLSTDLMVIAVTLIIGVKSNLIMSRYHRIIIFSWGVKLLETCQIYLSRHAPCLPSTVP